MRGPKPPAVALTEAERRELGGAGAAAPARRSSSRCGRGSSWRRRRARITRQIARRSGVGRRHGAAVADPLAGAGAAAARPSCSVAERLEDAPRPGGPCRITAAQVCRIAALACEAPAAAGAPDQPVDRARARRRGRPARHRGGHLAAPCRAAAQKGALQPHRIRYWLTPAPDPELVPKVGDVCGLYAAAPALAAAGERIVSTDELTGVQALERKHPGLPLAPGKVERREFEYVRHGTRDLHPQPRRRHRAGRRPLAAARPAPRRISWPTSARPSPPTPPRRRWHFVVDNLNIHQSESLVRYVAGGLGADRRPGRQGQGGHPGQPADPRRLPARPRPRDRLPLHPQARLLAQPDRDLAEHPDPQAAPARLLPLGRRPARPRCWPSSPTTTAPWPSPSSGPTRARRSCA